MMTALGILIAVLLIFWAGTAVGYRQARFSDDWENSYAHQFGGPGSPFVAHGGQDDSFMSAHGAFGQVVGVRLPEIIVKGSSESEKTVMVNASTIIRRFRAAATTTDLATGETVIVIGEPDSQGTIQASLIRIVPAPPANMPAPTTNQPTN